MARRRVSSGPPALFGRLEDRVVAFGRSLRLILAFGGTGQPNQGLFNFAHRLPDSSLVAGKRFVVAGTSGIGVGGSPAGVEDR